MLISATRWLRCALVFGIWLSGCAETTVTYTPLNVPPHDLRARGPEQIRGLLQHAAREAPCRCWPDFGSRGWRRLRNASDFDLGPAPERRRKGLRCLVARGSHHDDQAYWAGLPRSFVSGLFGDVPRLPDHAAGRRRCDVHPHAFVGHRRRPAAAAPADSRPTPDVSGPEGLRSVAKLRPRHWAEPAIPGSTRSSCYGRGTMRSFLRSVLGVALAVTLTAAALGGCGSSSKASGTVGGPCFTNGTCNAGLECLSNLCVQPAGAGGSGGAPGSAGASGQAGAAGGGGQATGAAGATAGAGGQAAGGAAGVGGGGGQSAAGASGSAGAGGAGGACTLIQDTFTGESADCKTCLAAHCCEQFNACESDSACQTYIDRGSSLEAAGPVYAPLLSCEGASCPTPCLGII